MLIASRGVPIQGEVCEHSISGRPFGGSVRLPGYFGGACANCKWSDHAARCTLPHPDEPVFEPAEVTEMPEALAIELLED